MTGVIRLHQFLSYRSYSLYGYFGNIGTSQTAAGSSERLHMDSRAAGGFLPQHSTSAPAGTDLPAPLPARFTSASAGTDLPSLLTPLSSFPRRRGPPPPPPCKRGGARQRDGFRRIPAGGRCPSGERVPGTLRAAPLQEAVPLCAARWLRDVGPTLPHLMLPLPGSRRGLRASRAPHAGRAHFLPVPPPPLPRSRAFPAPVPGSRPPTDSVGHALGAPSPAPGPAVTLGCFPLPPTRPWRGGAVAGVMASWALLAKEQPLRCQ